MRISQNESIEYSSNCEYITYIDNQNHAIK